MILRRRAKVSSNRSLKGFISRLYKSLPKKIFILLPLQIYLIPYIFLKQNIFLSHEIRKLQIDALESRKLYIVIILYKLSL